MDQIVQFKKKRERTQINKIRNEKGEVKTATLELNCKTEQSHTFRKHTMAAEREKIGRASCRERV